MSCKDCEKFQQSGMTSFFRWDTADIEIRGCPKHLKEVMDYLRTRYEPKETQNETKEPISYIADGIVEFDLGRSQRIAWQNGFDACVKWLEEHTEEMAEFMKGVKRGSIARSQGKVQSLDDALLELANRKEAQDDKD